jgi:hypothetical protein
MQHRVRVLVVCVLGVLVMAVSATPVYANTCFNTPGFYKNHPEFVTSPILLGTTTYSPAQQLAILGSPTGGNALVILAKALIAAKINRFDAGGFDQLAALDSAIAQADSLINGLVVGTNVVSTSSTLGQQMVSVASTLDTFNNLEGRTTFNGGRACTQRIP